MTITADELRFAAELEAYLDRQRAKWEAEDAKRGKPHPNANSIIAGCGKP
jgi:hypothetical protein